MQTQESGNSSENSRKLLPLLDRVGFFFGGGWRGVGGECQTFVLLCQRDPLGLSQNQMLENDENHTICDQSAAL